MTIEQMTICPRIYSHMTKKTKRIINNNRDSPDWKQKEHTKCRMRFKKTITITIILNFSKHNLIKITKTITTTMTL